MNIITKLALAVRFLGVRTVVSSIRYSIFKGLHDGDSSDPILIDSILPGKLEAAVAISNGANFRFTHSTLEILFLAPDLARITWGEGLEPVPYAQARTEWEPVETRLTQHGSKWEIESSLLKVQVDQDGSLHYIDALHRPLRHDLPPVFQGQAWRQRARLAPDERIHGLGEQAGPFNLRHTRRRLWNSDPGGSYGPEKDPIYTPLPVYMGLHSSGSYLVFYENSFPGLFDFGARDPDAGPNEISPGLATASFLNGLARCYFIPGSPRRALERFTELTGRPALPPRWSLGYHQSRWGYKTEGDIRALVQGFAENDLPLSAVHLDIDYMDGYRVFTVDRGRFPDLAGLVRELGQKEIRVVTIIDPGVKQDPEYDVYRQGMEQGCFCTLPDGGPAVGLVWPGWSLFPDFTDPKARAWWGSCYPRLLEAGVAGIWHDMNEPTSFAAWGDTSLPLNTRHALEGRGGDHRQAHNLYALLMNRAAFDALRAYRPESRPWLVSRAGWVSQSRYAWNWTGDTESSWPALKMTIHTLLGLGLSGQPFSGPDVGGFSGNPPAELYLRHFQMAAFLPFFRTHSALRSDRREPWVFGEPYTSILRKYLKLRYALLPYLYTLAWQASQSGHPLVRPLFWGREGDRHLWAVDDAFMLGDALLVAPVLEEGATARTVRLPAGGWYHFWDDAELRGPGEASLEAPLDRIPLLVRAGSLLPLEQDGRLVLHLYAPGGSTHLDPQPIYTDAGDGYGASRVDWFGLTQNEKGLEIEWTHSGEYPFPYPEIEIRLHGFTARHMRVDGIEHTCRENRLVIQKPFHRLQCFDLDSGHGDPR